MNNYLKKEQVRSSLKVGKAVEQWLGHFSEGNDTVLKWLRIYREKEEYNVMYIECYDQGNEDFIDVYDFTIIDPDEPYGAITSFSSIDQAIEFSKNEYGSLDDRFVTNGLIQQEYLKYLKQKS